MHPALAALLGVVEGLTEYLPVSSTGHLILTGRLLDMLVAWLAQRGVATDLKAHGAGADAFDIVIQLGAILAVLVHYRALLVTRLRGLVVRDEAAVRLFSSLVIAFVPTAIAGFLLRKLIKQLLFGPIQVACALIVGGIVMIVIERVRKKRGETGLVGLEHVTPKRALAIGLGQCISMWPGSSRSMCTIVAGQLTGLSTATAAEFSFLLGLPTLGAATCYEAWKSRHVLAHEIGVASLATGLVVSFFVAWAVVALFIRYLQRRGLEPFGYYRIVAGALMLLVFLR
jgi:undecaprenyl-diphosphatase